jgi:hypothetical protein
VATAVPFPVLLKAAAAAQVTPLAPEHATVTAPAGGLLQPVKFAPWALAYMVKPPLKIV